MSRKCRKETNSFLFATIIPTTYYCHYLTSNVFVGALRMHMTEKGKKRKETGKETNRMNVKESWLLWFDNRSQQYKCGCKCSFAGRWNREKFEKRLVEMMHIGLLAIEENQSLYINTCISKMWQFYLFVSFLFSPLYSHLRYWACEKKLVRMERITLPFSNGKNNNKQRKITYIELS